MAETLIISKLRRTTARQLTRRAPSRPAWHKDLWLIDLATGAERQLTQFPPEFSVRDFDISPDGREIVVEQVQEQSDIVLIEIREQ